MKFISQAPPPPPMLPPLALARGPPSARLPADADVAAAAVDSANKKKAVSVGSVPNAVSPHLPLYLGRPAQKGRG